MKICTFIWLKLLCFSGGEGVWVCFDLINEQALPWLELTHPIHGQVYPERIVQLIQQLDKLLFLKTQHKHKLAATPGSKGVFGSKGNYRYMLLPFLWNSRSTSCLCTALVDIHEARKRRQRFFFKIGERLTILTLIKQQYSSLPPPLPHITHWSPRT